jgi:regulatory protein
MDSGLTLKAEAETQDQERQINAAHERALGFLSFRPRSRREVERNLWRHGVSPEVVEAVLTRLAGTGLIDDAGFAGYWAGNRQQFSPRGDRAIRQELAQRGVARDVIAEALTSLPDESERALGAGRKKLRTFASLSEDHFRRRMTAFLQRRGFDYQVARSATDAIWSEMSKGAAHQTDEPFL